MNLTRLMPCLDEDVCDEVIAYPGHYSRATTIDGENLKEYEGRTNSGTVLVGPLERKVHGAINSALLAWSQLIEKEYPEVAATFALPGVSPGLETYREALSLLKYEKGQEYVWHVDQPYDVEQSGNTDAQNRLISVVLYLNDDFEGGHTEMFGRKFEPKKGKVLIFPSNWNYPHRACPVTKGTKYAVVTWFHKAYN